MRSSSANVVRASRLSSTYTILRLAGPDAACFSLSVCAVCDAGAAAMAGNQKEKVLP